MVCAHHFSCDTSIPGEQVILLLMIVINTVLHSSYYYAIFVLRRIGKNKKYQVDLKLFFVKLSLSCFYLKTEF